ncbi:MAG: hypothetical protein QXK51_01195 [Candidatus Methanomethylicia archaeon]
MCSVFPLKIWRKNEFAISPLLFFEFAYLLLSYISAPPLLMALIIFPGLFMVPGMVLLMILKDRIDGGISRLIVEGFFISIILTVMLTSIMIIFSIPLTPLTYSISTFTITLILILIGLARKVKIKLNNNDYLLILIVPSIYIILLLFFNSIPRFFSPDETYYIFSARMLILNGTVPVIPFKNDVISMFRERYFWIYLLASFLGATGLPAYQAGLVSIGFLVMTALASSLILKDKWLRIAAFILIITNPLLLSFSALALNDLVITFLSTFTVLFFIKSFPKDTNSISIPSLLLSFLGVLILAMVKPNIIIFIAIWIILIFIIVRYKLFEINKYKILLLVLLVPVLLYELCVDIPYVILLWILRDEGSAALVSRFIIIGLAERFVMWFSPPWWDQSIPTIFTCSFIQHLECLYRIFMPESLSLVVPAMILTSPILLKRRSIRVDETMLILITFISLALFYPEAVRQQLLDDVSRYGLFMIPLWIPLTLTVLRRVKEMFTIQFPLQILTTSLLLLWINIWISKRMGGVSIGYRIPSRMWTVDLVLIQLIFIVVVTLLFQRNIFLNLKLTIARKTFLKPIILKLGVMRNITLIFLIILMVLNGIYFGITFIGESARYDDHGFITLIDVLNIFPTKGLIFTNNYIHMRSYVNDAVIQQGLLLPPPDSENELFNLMEAAPNGTLLLISNDADSTWYEYANKYIKQYINHVEIKPRENRYSCCATRICSLSLPKGKVALFNIINNKTSTQSILISKVNAIINENRTITLNIDINSLESKNATILIATDRSTRVYTLSLSSGLNNVNLHYPYIDPIRLVVLEDHNISYNEFIVRNTQAMNTLLSSLLLITLILYLTLYRFHR